MSPAPLRGPLLLAGILVALTACGGNGFQNGVSGTTAAAPPTTTADSRPTSTGESRPTSTGSASTTQVPAGYPARPGKDECVIVPEATDGSYTVYEAGTAVVTREGDRLVLGAVEAADGWAGRVDDQDDDEIEIDFRAGRSDVLDLEVEIDDGRLEVQICADDD